MGYSFLFDTALILLSTKAFGLVTKRFDMPQVVGALLAGLIFGPAMLGILHETTFMDQVAEIGVIVLMFTAGLETDIQELKRSGKASFVIALAGVVLPLAGGFAVAALFNKGTDAVLQNVFIGVILTATSVSISVETLKELGQLSTRSGNAILGAALIDDILGIICLTVITSLADKTVNIAMVSVKIVAFFVLSGVIGFLAHKGMSRWMNDKTSDKRRFVVVAFAFCLLYAYVAERFFGVADITGAFIAGLVISNTGKTTYIASRFETSSYMLLSPIFFASIGAKVLLPEMTPSIILFSVLLLVIAVLTKVVGCGAGAKLCGYSGQDSLRIGCGMISRGEVALIVATKGVAVGLMVQNFFGPVIVMVVATTIVTPILLRLVYRGAKTDYSGMVQSELVEQYQKVDEFDLAAQNILNREDALRARQQAKSAEESANQDRKQKKDRK